MPKTKISEFSTTPGDNTDINGINIAEGCAPSGINNAIRELMSDLKEWQSGAMDVYVVPQGTAAAPAVQFYADTDTGIYRYGANQVGVAVGGVSAGYFSSAGWNGNVNGTITGDINATTIDTTNLEVTNVKAKDGTAAFSIADSTGAVSVTTLLNVDNVRVDGNTISSTNTNGAINISPNGSGQVVISNGNIQSGQINSATIGSSTPSSGAFTTLSASSTATLNTLSSSGATLTGGTINNMAIGGVTPAAGAFTTLSATGNATLSGGTANALLYLNASKVVTSGSKLQFDGTNLTVDSSVATTFYGSITVVGNTVLDTVDAGRVDTLNLEVTNIKAKDGTAAITLTDSTGAVGISTAVTMSATTQNIALGTSQTSGTFTVGGASQTGTQTFDQSTKSHTLNIGTGATESAATKTINIGTAGVSGSTTTLNIGSSVSGATSTINLNGTVNATTVNFTTLDLTNVEVTNIKAKDGTASITLADATGVATFSANPILNAGTANGVAYLNGSKVLTTGSALTFDGTTFATTGRTSSANGAWVASGAVMGWGAAGTFTNYIVGDTASNYLLFQVNSAEQMRLTSTGLGIGTSSPQRRIHGYIATGPVARLQTNGSNAAIEYVPGATDGTGTIFNWVVGAQYNIGNAFEITPSTAAGGLTFSSPALVVTSGGNVGIGTTSPGYKTEVRVSGAGSTLDGLYVQNGTAGGIFQVTGASYSYRGVAANNLWIGTNSGHDMYIGPSTANVIKFGTAAFEQMRLDASGNLGLGVTPSAWAAYKAVQIGRGSFVSDTSSSSTYGTIVGANWFYDGANKYIINGLASFYQQDAGQHRWWTATNNTSGAGASMSPVQAMTLDASGNLTVGTGATSPGLTVNGATSGTTGGAAISVQNGGSYRIVMGNKSALVGGGYSNEAWLMGQSELVLAVNGSERARITSGGDLLVAKSALSQTTVGFQVEPSGIVSDGLAASANTTTTLNIYSTGAAAYRFYVGLAGTVYATSTTITGISDVRLKENIRDLEDGLSSVLALKPRKFDWKEGKGKNIKGDRGFIAQEFEQVFPDMIDEWNDPAPEGEEPYKAVNANLIPTLVKAIQEQQAMINELKAKVAALEGK